MSVTSHLYPPPPSIHSDTLKPPVEKNPPFNPQYVEVVPPKENDPPQNPHYDPSLPSGPYFPQVSIEENLFLESKRVKWVYQEEAAIAAVHTRVKSKRTFNLEDRRQSGFLSDAGVNLDLLKKVKFESLKTTRGVVEDLMHYQQQLDTILQKLEGKENTLKSVVDIEYRIKETEPYINRKPQAEDGIKTLKEKIADLKKQLPDRLKTEIKALRKKHHYTFLQSIALEKKPINKDTALEVYTEIERQIDTWIGSFQQKIEQDRQPQIKGATERKERPLPTATIWTA